MFLNDMDPEMTKNYQYEVNNNFNTSIITENGTNIDHLVYNIATENILVAFKIGALNQSNLKGNIS